jgi:hypothetical protein
MGSTFQIPDCIGLLLEKLKAENDLFYGWVIDHNNDLKSNGKNYQTPMQFYLKQGFEILKDNRIESEMIHVVKVKWSLNPKECKQEI